MAHYEGDPSGRTRGISLVGDDADNLCQCPTCGRMHKNLGFGKPPEAIAGPSLLRPAEAIAPAGPEQASLYDSVARALFGPRNHVWDKRWAELHESGLKFQSWTGSEPTEGKGFYRAQAGIAINEALSTLRRRLSDRLNNHLADMQPGYDDSITGFNEAWDIARRLLDEMTA